MSDRPAIEAVDPAADRAVDLDRYGPWAVIAGGSEGVGASFARQLAESGFNLVLVARKPGPLEETASSVRALGVEVRTLSLDLTDAASVEKLAGATADLEVGLLIYNAGANSYGRRFLDGDLDGFRGVIDLNVTTPLALAHHYGRLMRTRGKGGIVLVGSLAGYLGTPREAVYGGAKAFGRIFAEGFWLEAKEAGIDVLELVLGLTRTPAMERAGLNFDLPGMVVGEPDAIAREGLAAIGDGPVHVISGNEGVVAMRGSADRAKLVVGTHQMMQKLVPETAG
ncbi:SDR family NAD(P)-dependent oxidoreductase [Nocardioides sp. GY 10113]|uniref:SDR family NAD(P)-dependent oxidoreductase n=1 Tax=Nocardioides sp. GY 10113 TaxID=2569761 RepID=UPI0010A8E984|nr:SDR family NAD(P)-dependent oxidoreductase [Nocardioides sp. GY 10113]TIC85118.1 SDR family NAD(P)-dependent oxidoreductase [Nocardioides sp. GY 10113]